VPAVRPRGKKLFHDRGWHRSGGLPASLQLLLAGVILGVLVPGARRGQESSRVSFRTQRGYPRAG
jgi:hypothetical protein